MSETSYVGSTHYFLTLTRNLKFGLVLVCLAFDASLLRLVSLLPPCTPSPYNDCKVVNTGAFIFGILNDIFGICVSGYYFYSLEINRGSPPVTTDFVICGLEVMLWLIYTILEFIYYKDFGDLFIGGPLSGAFVLVLSLIATLLLYQLYQSAQMNPRMANNSGMGMNNSGMGMNNPGMGTNNSGMGMNNPGMGMNNPGMGMNNSEMGMNNPGMGMNNSVMVMNNPNTSGYGLHTSGIGLNTSGIGLNNSGGMNSPGYGISNPPAYGMNNSGYVMNNPPSSPNMSNAVIENKNAGSEISNAGVINNAGVEHV